MRKSPVATLSITDSSFSPGCRTVLCLIYDMTTESEQEKKYTITYCLRNIIINVQNPLLSNSLLYFEITSKLILQ